MITEHILADRQNNLSKVLLEHLIRGMDLPLDDATCKGPELLQYPTLQLHWGKAIQGGGNVMKLKDFYDVPAKKKCQK